MVDVTVTFLFAILGLKIGHLKPQDVIKESPGEATLYGIGGHRVDSSEHEAALPG
jgi:hypothetical protein